MSTDARHENLRQIASALRQLAEARRSALSTPHLRQQLGHMVRIADAVQVVLRPNALHVEMLDLAETVLRGLDRQLRECEEAAAAHALRQGRFLGHSLEHRVPQRTKP
jgi:hypothetical protein